MGCQEFQSTNRVALAARDAHVNRWGALHGCVESTAMNHADPTRVPSTRYKFVEPGVIEIYAIRDISSSQGEECFNDYGEDFIHCAWYDQAQHVRGDTPLSHLPALINNMYSNAVQA